MNRHRISRPLGAAAGGLLLGLAFLPAAVAVADDSDDLVPTSTGVIADGGIRNFLLEVPPAAQGGVQGYQQFAVDDPSGTNVGTVDADVTNSVDVFGDTNREILVTSDGGAANVGTATADLPPAGSLLDTYTYTDGFQVAYSDIPGAGPNDTDLISYTWAGLTIPTTYDAIATVPATVDGTGDFAGDTFVPVGDETVDGVNGIPPADYDLLGTQTFDVDNASGAQTGIFTADVANSSDVAANTTQDLLVTSSSGDAPAVGSVYDYFFSDTGSGHSTYNVYSDVPSTTGGSDTITDTIVTPYGSSSVPTTFDAAYGLADVLKGGPLGTAIELPQQFDITPVATSPGTIVAIDGIQPEDIDVQGSQLFEYDNTATGQTGTFDADVAQSAIVFGDNTQEQLVVAQDVSGDAPQVGSVFEVSDFGGGVEQIYSDMAGALPGGANEITETWVTPFGDFSIPDTYDASAILAGAPTFAAATTDPVDGLDSSSGLDAASLFDPFAHLDAALQSLLSLF